MSNQPKITYRSDSTRCTYQMQQKNGSLTVQVVNLDGIVIDESHEYIYLKPWRSSINCFFDVVETHINTNRWDS